MGVRGHLEILGDTDKHTNTHITEVTSSNPRVLDESSTIDTKIREGK